MIRWLGVIQDKFSSSVFSDNFASGLLLIHASTSVKTVLNSVSVSIAPWSVFISGFLMVPTIHSINPIAIDPLFGLRGGGVDYTNTLTVNNSKVFGF